MNDLRARVVAGEEVSPDELRAAIEEQYGSRMGLIHALANKAASKKGKKKKDNGVVEQVEGI